VATVRAEAQASLEPPDLIEVERAGIDSRAIHGFVVGISTNLLLLHRMGDRLDLDGFECVRVADVTMLRRTFRRKEFYLKALELKGCRAVVPEGVELGSVRDLLRSVERRYPLVVIHRELVVPDECEIGRIKLTSEATYALRMLTPEATWMHDEEVYRYGDVTRVGFDGEYENTLSLVAGAAV
jgi:hypothetical protein